MSIITRNRDLMPSLPTLMERFFNDGEYLSPYNGGFDLSKPAVNIAENDQEFFIEVAAPGLSKSDFNLEVENDQLTISYHKEEKNEEKDQANQYTRREFSFRSFSRSFAMPEHVVDTDKIKANYKDGILKVQLPKKEEAKPRPPKQISIS